MRSKVLALMIILVLLVGVGLPAMASVEEDVRKEVGQVAAGTIIEVEFPYEVPESEIEVPEGLEYLGYYNGTHSFRATEDRENVVVYLYYTKEDKLGEVVTGEASNNGEVGKAPSDIPADWETFQFGKVVWTDGDELQYAIRLKAGTFVKGESVIVKDIPNMPLSYVVEPYVVGYMYSDVHLRNPQSVESTTYEDDVGFEVDFTVADYDVYEVNYRVKKEEGQTNSFIAMQKGETIVSGGEISGEAGPVVEETMPEEVSPETPEEPEELPTEPDDESIDKEEERPTIEQERPYIPYEPTTINPPAVVEDVDEIEEDGPLEEQEETVEEEIDIEVETILIPPETVEREELEEEVEEDDSIPEVKVPEETKSNEKDTQELDNDTNLNSGGQKLAATGQKSATILVAIGTILLAVGTIILVKESSK